MGRKSLGTSAEPESAAVARISQPEKAVNRVETKADGFFSVYVNDMQIQVSPWDIRLMLGEISGVTKGDAPAIAVTALGEVRMSPQLAKRVVMILKGQLQQYEENFGVIPTPKD